MSRASATAEAAATAAVLALITDLSLHTADPGTTGASEYSGVTRQAVSWSAGANTNAQTFTTSGATAVPYMGGYSAVTAGTYELGFVLGSSVTAVTITAAIGAVTAATT